jgi:hypothetical protein
MQAVGFGAAANAVANAADDVAKRAFTVAEVEVLDQIVAGLPKARQLEIGRQLLDHPQVLGTPLVRGPLAAIRTGLEDVTSEHVQVTTMLANVRASIDQELGRMAGTVEPTVLVDGTFHPNYSVVGSIGSNLRSLAGFGVI